MRSDRGLDRLLAFVDAVVVLVPVRGVVILGVNYGALLLVFLSGAVERLLR